MALTAYFVVQPFEAGKGGRMKALPAIQAQSRAHAERMAQRLGERGGAVAFSREGDPATGEYEDAEIIGVFGEIPDGAMDTLAA